MTFSGLSDLTVQEWHAILVHFPIALALAGVPLVYVTAVIATDRKAIRWVTVILYLVVAAGAYAAWWSGERAKDHVLPTYPEEVWETLLTHANLAQPVWVAALITALLVLLGAVKYNAIRIGAMTLAVISSVITATLVGVTGHYGGQLVYRYGIGTPSAALLYAAQPAAAMPEPVLPEASPAAEPAAPRERQGHFFGELLGDGTSGDVPDSAAPATDAETLEPAVSGQDAAIPIRPILAVEAQSVHYSRDVVPILDKHCFDCHYDGEAEGDLLLTSVEEMLIGGKKAGPAIIPGDPDNSPLILYIRGILKPQMPKRLPPLSDEEVHILRMWIHAGARDDSQTNSLASGSTPAPAPSAPAAD